MSSELQSYLITTLYAVIFHNVLLKDLDYLIAQQLDLLIYSNES